MNAKADSGSPPVHRLHFIPTAELPDVGPNQGGTDGQGVVVPKGPEALCPVQNSKLTESTSPTSTLT